MKSLQRALLIIAACLAMNLLVVGMSAAAGETYFAGRFGYGVVTDIDRDWGGAGGETTIKYDSPWNVGLAFGYRVNWARLEGEISYYNIGVKEGEGPSGDLRNLSGRDLFYVFMFNAFADLRNDTQFTPFIGVGIGAAMVDHDISFTTPTGAARISGSDQDWVFAYQFMVGLEWSINPQLSMEAMYRYLHVNSRTHDVSGGTASDVKLDPSNVHMLVVGVRLWF